MNKVFLFNDSNAKKPCKFETGLPFGYVSECRQKYQTHTIKAVNEKDQTIVDEPVYYPSGCECKYRQKKRDNS